MCFPWKNVYSCPLVHVLVRLYEFSIYLDANPLSDISYADMLSMSATSNATQVTDTNVKVINYVDGEEEDFLYEWFYDLHGGNFGIDREGNVTIFDYAWNKINFD